MMRARAVFMACKFGDTRSGHSSAVADLESQSRNRQLFSEVLVAEDVDLGSRIHALGYKSVFLDEVLALGEVCKTALLKQPCFTSGCFTHNLCRTQAFQHERSTIP
jgi:hypothetical protein